MADPRGTPPPRAFACARCGALNGADFGRCIRCNSPLFPAPSAGAEAKPGFGQRSRPAQAEQAPDVHHYWATKTLVWATLVIFAGQVLASLSRGTGFPFLSGGHPADDLRFGAMQIDARATLEEPFRLLSCVFVHAGALHFGLNMMGLVNFARVAEPAVGSARFIIAYVVSGIAGSAATIGYSLLTGPRGLTVGASGAIFGVMGLLLGWLIRKRHPAWKDFAVQAVLFSVLFGFGVNRSNMGIMINNAAHIGGLLCGIVFGLIYGGRRRDAPSPTSDLLATIGAAVCLALCITSLVLAQLSPRWRKLDRSLSAAVVAPSSPLSSAAPPRANKDRVVDI